MVKRMVSPLIWGGRLLLAGVFLAACIHKIAVPAAFAQDVFHYQLLPPLWVNAVALVLPWLELTCAICLLAIPPLRRSSLWWISLMLVVFMAAQGINIVRGVDIACGCFSSEGGHRLSMWNILRNLGLMVVAVMLLMHDGGKILVRHETFNKE